MTVVAQTGLFGFGPQAGKEIGATTLYKHRANDIDLAIISDDRLGPPEVGGTPTPTVPYRAGVVAQGGATIAPRLENTFGWLLYATAGHVETEDNEDVFGSTEAGFYHHTFSFNPDAEGLVPWMTFYKEIPGITDAQRIAETYEDCKVVNHALVLPNDGLIQSRIDVIGRMANDNQLQEGPSTVFGNTEYEDFQSIPLGSVEGSYIQVPEVSGEDLPIIQCSVNFQNAPLDMAQEKVFGSPFLEDVTIIGRQMTVEMIVKWQDADLYRAIITGSPTGTAWTPCPFIADLDVYAQTGECDEETAPWQIRVTAPEVVYQMEGGITIAGNEAVMMRLRGTVIKGTGYYYKIHLGNRTPAYTWPSPP